MLGDLVFQHPASLHDRLFYLEPEHLLQLVQPLLYCKQSTNKAPQSIERQTNEVSWQPGPKPTLQPRFLPGYNGFNKPMSFPASTDNPSNRMYGDSSTSRTRSSPVTYGDHTYGEVSYGARTGNEYFSSGSQSTSVYSRPSSVRPLQSARFSAVLRNFTPGPKINACASPGLLRTPPKTIGDRYDNTPSVTSSRGNVQEPPIASSREESPEPDADELTQQSIREDMLAESLGSLAAATYPTTPHSTIKKGTQMLLSSLTKSADFVAGSARAGANAVTSILKSATRRNGGVRRVLFRFGTETIDTLDTEVREDSVHSDRSHGSYASNGSHGSHASNGSHNSHGYEGSQASRSSGSSSSVGHIPSQGSQGFGQYVEEPDEDHIPSYVKSDKYHEMFMTHNMAFKPRYPVPPDRGLPHYLNKQQHEIKLADMWHVGQMELGKLPRNTAPPTDENHVHFAQQHGWVDSNPNQRADSESDYHEPEYSTPETPPPVTPRRSPRFKAQAPISVASPSGSVSPASSNNSQRRAARERATNGGDRMDMCRDGAESRFGMRLVSATEASPGAALFGVVINTPTAYPRIPIVSSSAKLSAPLKAGDLVLRLRPDNTFSTGKLEKLDKYDGPFVISSIAADFATLEFPVHSDANRWVPLKHLKRYVGSITAGSLREATISTIPGLAAVKKVALVREVRTMNGMTQLRVSWHGWPAEDDTWEPAQAVPDEVLEDFTERWEAAEYI